MINIFKLIKGLAAALVIAIPARGLMLLSGHGEGFKIPVIDPLLHWIIELLRWVAQVFMGVSKEL